ncbi:uncharacterized protein LOC129598142 [Paramacrobiotus metropolitanus]|uniref:uncharacterized protein LOC129598142 n=1 Tax=Paramacrobiotus metropolitanus TaxID=2943436 RepID=UPI0024464AA6|nr:uncharacterized protein LOC129598142 [Paramacrobiotus metropolitanus]
MGKSGKTFAAILNRDQTWAYHEIIAEALFVLWTGCHLSLKFGTRFFPEWETTRIDPDSYTSLDRLLWLLLRQNITGCVWDDVVSHWKPVSTGRGIVGYTGAISVLGMTLFLGVSFLCSAWVNRDWHIPRWTQHLRHCRRITTWFGYRTTYDGDEWDVPTEGGWRFWTLWFLVSLASMTVFVGLWLVFCALPVVIVAGLTVAWIGRHVGEEVVFPATVVCFGLLVVHCTGRIWGFGMKKTYFTQWHEMIRYATGRRLLVQPFAADRENEIAHTTETATDPWWCVRRARLHALYVVVFPAWYAVVNHSANVLQQLPFPAGWMDPFYHVTRVLYSFLDHADIRDSPSASASTSASEISWTTTVPSTSTSAASSYWKTVTCTECCDNFATGLPQWNAMLSYYVDLKYPPWTTDNPTMVALFNTVFSPVTERFYLAWMTTIAWVVGLPMIVMGLAGVVGMPARCAWHCFRALITKPKKVLDNAEDLNEKERSPEKSAIEPKKKPFCVCALWMAVERLILVVFSRCAIWLCIPFPVLELIVPEQYLLPAWLLLLSVIEVGLYCCVWKTIRYRCRERHADGDDSWHRGKAVPEDGDALLLAP